MSISSLWSLSLRSSHRQQSYSNRTAEAAHVAEWLGDAVRLSRLLLSQTDLLSATGDLASAIAIGEQGLALLVGRDDLMPPPTRA